MTKCISSTGGEARQLFNEQLLKLYPGHAKVYGPYLRDDDREVLILYAYLGNGKTKRRTISYPKAIYEVRQGKRLPDGYSVDHENKNLRDNSPQNLQALPVPEHSRKDVRKARYLPMECPGCGKMFTPTKGQARTRGKTGPYCSRACGIKNARRNIHLGRKEVQVEYYY